MAETNLPVTAGVGDQNVSGYLDNAGNFVQRVTVNEVAGDTQTTPTSFNYGQVVVAVTNVAVQLPSHAIANNVIQALVGNSSNSFVIGSDSGVTVTGGAQPGYELQPGQPFALPVTNTNAYWINGTAGDGVCWAAN